MLHNAVLALFALSFASKKMQVKPLTSKFKSTPYSKLTEELYLSSLHFKNKAANKMINKEFKFEK